jgi:lipopolysaccharide export system permease protein
MGRTLHRYVFLQILAPFAAGLALFTFILLIARIMKLVELVVNRGVPVLEILRVFSYILPAFLEVTVPMALLLAVLLACGRLSADSEITALKAAGLSLYQIATPVAAFAFLVFVVSLFLSLYARPWGNSALKSAIFDLARTRASVGLKEHVFNDEFKGLVIYVEEIEPPGSNLLRILISDRRQPSEENTVVAKRGTLVAHEDTRSVNLRLFDGVIFTSRASEHGYHKTDFSTYDVNLNLGEALGQMEMREREPSELPLADIRSRIATAEAAGEPARAEHVEVARRLSVPFAAIVFALIGVPLGLQPVRAVRSRGLAVSLVIILSYYLMLSAAETLATQGRAPVTLALWTPNLVLASIGAVLFFRQAQETSLPGESGFARVTGLAWSRLAMAMRRAS